MTSKYWEITGYNRDEVFFRKEVSFYSFSERRIKELLKVLSAKASLSYEEIIGAYARRDTKIHNDLLKVQKEQFHPEYCCGENPYFVAQVRKK